MRSLRNPPTSPRQPAAHSEDRLEFEWRDWRHRASSESRGIELGRLTPDRSAAIVGQTADGRACLLIDEHRQEEKEEVMGVRRRLVSAGVVLIVALLLGAVLMGCSPCDILPIPGAEPEIQFWASEQVVPHGGCTLLHWEVSGAEDYPIFFNGDEVAPTGQVEMCLEESTTFELVVAAPGGSIREMVTIAVEPPEGEPPPEEPPPSEPPPEEPPPEGGPEVIIVIVDPDAIAQGGCAMLHWEVHPPEWPVLINGQEVPPIGEREECPQSTTTYELVVEAPGGPQQRSVTLHVEGGEEPAPPQPTSTSPPPGATATQPPPAQPTSTQPPPAQPTATTFVPVWGQCTWVPVHPTINSHQPNTWCPNGSFLTGLDLDQEASYDAMDSPVVGQAQCCPLSVAQFSPWGQCSWVRVHPAKNSHQPEVWCPSGQYLTGLDLDREASYDPLDSPVVGQGFCCPLGDPKYTGWGSCSWEKVEQAGIKSHQAVTWCPNGSFLAGLDLDRISADAKDSPGVGQAYCCSPN